MINAINTNYIPKLNVNGNYSSNGHGRKIDVMIERGIVVPVNEGTVNELGINVLEAIKGKILSLYV